MVQTDVPTTKPFLRRAGFRVTGTAFRFTVRGGGGGGGGGTRRSLLSRLVFITGVLDQVEVSQADGLLDERPPLGVAEAPPAAPESPADLGVVQRR